MAECEQEREHAADLDPNQFCCSICLDLLKDPVGIPCGHSYCKGCIEGCWDQKEAKEDEEEGKYSCPQCRQIFSPRPALGRNHMLAEVVEMLKRSGIRQASPSAAEAAAAEACTGPADITCDFCCGNNPNKAVMSCLMCAASYCVVHLEPHYSIPVLKKHQLVSATMPLQDKMCTKHHKLMEVYCQTDRKCICHLCLFDEHKGHSTVSAAAERDEQQKQLTVNQKQVQDREKEREKELTALLHTMKEFWSCSKTAQKMSDKLCSELMSSIKEKFTLMKQQIKAQEKKAISEAEGLQFQLEDEIAKLKMRDTELEQISHIDDHIHFIRRFQSLSASCESPDLPNGLVVPSKRTFKTVSDSLSKMKEDMDGLLKNQWPSLSAKVSTIIVLRHPEPKTREELLRYCCPLTLDENSVSQNVSLSQENLQVMCKTQEVPSNKNGYNSYTIQRMTGNEQMWCKNGVTERCYWEVTLSGGTWCVAVSYKSSSGTPSYNSVFGQDDRSWSLECSSSSCSIRHNNGSMGWFCHPSSQVGVYLDCTEGSLSFYSVSGLSVRLIHKVETTFTEPLYPCIGLMDDGSQQGQAFYAQLVKIW